MRSKSVLDQEYLSLPDISWFWIIIHEIPQRIVRPHLFSSILRILAAIAWIDTIICDCMPESS